MIRALADTVLTVLSYLAILAAFGLCGLLGLLTFINLKSIASFIDGLFETKIEKPADDLKPGDPLGGTLDLGDVALTELSAADIRRQTEILLALKEQLDADGESARAEIRRERERAQQQSQEKAA